MNCVLYKVKFMYMNYLSIKSKGEVKTSGYK